VRLAGAAGDQGVGGCSSKLSMIDHWLGRIIDVVDRHDAWGSTALVLCTDHGHYLGERGIWGKPQVPVYPEMGHIPLLISWPGVAARTCDALVIAGENDPRCPPEGIVPWVEALRARGITVEAHFYPEGHHANTNTQQVRHMQLILDFFARYV